VAWRKVKPVRTYDFRIARWCLSAIRAGLALAALVNYRRWVCGSIT
jgi:hypothetical protein